jgi:hypothetical protein
MSWTHHAYSAHLYNRNSGTHLVIPLDARRENFEDFSASSDRVSSNRVSSDSASSIASTRLRAGTGS